MPDPVNHLTLIERETVPPAPARNRKTLFLDSNGKLKAVDENGAVESIGGGVAGPKGEKGDTGTQGPAGSTGPAGATGPQGPQGDPGPAGADGAPGATGPTGPAGATGATGSTGATGATGAAGAAATIAVGTVTTGAAGSSATVTNVGSSSAATFNFTIPRGDTGATGATGAAGANGGLVRLGEFTLGSDTASVSFSSISSGYKSLRLVFQARTNYGGDIFDDVRLRLNGDTTTTNYFSSIAYGGSSTGGGNYNNATLSSATSNTPAAGICSQTDVTFINYLGTTFHKTWSGTHSSHRGSFYYAMSVAGRWANTAAITDIVLLPINGTAFKTGSYFALYGIN